MLTHHTHGPVRGQRRSGERGVVLLVALIILVIMTLAGIALMRSVSTSGIIAGNLAFQQSATHSADVGVETAVSFLEGSSATTLQTSDLTGATRYVAHRQDPAPGQSWDNFWANSINPAAINTLAADPAGNTVSYVIHRLCNGDGVAITGVACSASPLDVGSAGNSKGGGVVALISPPQIYYRITTRVGGPRNTSSFVQVVVAL